jgi:Fur family zinc uptake transcriptional regulator
LSKEDRIEKAKAVCEQHGERFTPLRAHIFELLVESEGPIKAYDLLDKLRPERGSPKPPTVYRALDFFSRMGLIHRVEALNAYITCDHIHDGHAAEFFICETCDRVQERHAEDHSNCRPKGFNIRHSVIEHYGTCESCPA